MQGVCSSQILEKLILDLRKMLPVWLIMLTLVIGALFAIRANAVHYLEAGIIEQSHAPSVAEVTYLAGVHTWRQVVKKVETSAKQGDFIGKPGELSGDPLVEKALEQFSKTLEIFPLVPDTHTKLAQLEYWNGNEAQAYFHLAKEALLQNNLQRAEYNLSHAILLEPENQEFQLSLASNFARQYRWDKAKEISESLTMDVEKSAEALQLLARIRLAEGDKNGALELTEKALKVNPSLAESYEIYLSIVFDRDDLLERLAFLEENLKGSTFNSPTIYHQIGLLYIEKESYEDALRLYEQVVLMVPQNVRILVEKAFILAKLNRQAEARLLLERALSINYDGFIEYLQDEKFDQIRDLAPKTSNGEQ